MLGILGFAELGINKVDSADKTKLLKYFSRIHTSGSRLLLLLNNLLDLSKLDANQMAFTIEKHSIKEVLDQVTTELIPLINSRELQINVTSENETFIAEFDNQKIHQVIYNLLSNAVKFSPDKGVISIDFNDDTIKINEIEVPAIKISIADQGIGIPEEELTTIFNKFSQSTRTNTGAGGTGLGLSISKDICKYHHGKLWAENLLKPEQGAKLSLVLPKTFISHDIGG
jgi:signal transduction histidine kinase